MTNRLRKRLAATILTSAALALFATVKADAAPAIKSLSLRGLQTGAVATLVIEGTDLIPDPQIVLPVAIAKAELKQPATAERMEVEITLDASVLPGIYPLRVANKHGISGAVTVGIDDLPQRPFGTQIDALPVALHGSLVGGTILRTSFAGKAGQKIVADVESHRLASKLDPVVHLLDERNVQLAWSQMVPSIAGDARIAATLPADGRYTVELHDALYRGGEPGHFRLKIGDIHYADLVFPLGGGRGTKGSFELVATNLTEGAKIDADLNVPAAGVPAVWPTGKLLTGSRPQIIVGDFPDTFEQSGGATPQEVPVPSAINGRLSAPHERDRYVLAVTAGQTLRFDVVAARAGSPLDGVLSVQKESGEQLAAADDGKTTTDPTLDFKVPDGLTKIVVVLKDLLDRGGPDYVYRLIVAPADLPDFRLELFEDRHLVARGGAAIARVRAQRAGYNGPIKLGMAGLPAGVTLTNDEIPAGATDALLSLAAGDASPAHAIANIVGTSADGNPPLVRAALATETEATKHQPWLRGDVAVAVTGNAPLTVAWEADSTSAQLPLASKLPAKIKASRALLAAGPIKLSLVTTQITPQKEVTEKDGRKRQVDDVERTLRLDGKPTIDADKTETTAAIIVPADLPGIPYDVAIRAELLAADRKTVAATAVTPARRMTTVQPLRIELAGEPKVEAKAGSGETGRLVGKIHRLGDFPYPVTVTLAGLSADYVAPSVEVPAGQSDFSLPVSFAFSAPQGDLANVALVATAQPQAGALVRSNDLPVAVKVVAGGPPPALYRVFEDEPYFAGLLNEGGGKAGIESLDRYSGSAAIRVTPDQKFRAKLPGLGVKIAEKPGDGEYRYLRFAWKKIGGGSVLLQLNANGAWGPARGQGTPGYRYEAGPASNTLNAEAIKTTDKLPFGWTVVTRDLFADFGAFQLDGLAFTPGDGEAALFDHIYLAHSEADFKDCPAGIPAEPPLAVFEDQPEFVANLTEGAGAATLVSDDKLTGTASVKVTPEQRYRAALPGLQVKIRQNPGPGEYRYLQFAWKKQGGERVCLQLNHDGQWGPVRTPAKFRYDAGAAAGETYGAAVRVDNALPGNWTVVTRDLYADFGDFTLDGLALSPVDGEFALFDHIYLGRTLRDFDLAPQ
ncbi:MAG: hypothetical protein HYX69_12065 [Planctomycetia bacterium]|nr:hypothetical protein [Planctomycetia bacterium]